MALLSHSGGRSEDSGPQGRSIRAGRNRDQGMVTAEFAVVMVAFAFVLTVSLGVAALAISHVQSQEAARLGARSAARGDSDRMVVEVVRRAAPGARTRIRRAGGDVRVEVAIPVRVPIVGLGFGPIEVRAHSIAERERA